MQRTLRLGTRGSLLAMAQSRQIAAQLMSLHPGLDVQLHPVSDTRRPQSVGRTAATSMIRISSPPNSTRPCSTAKWTSACTR